MRGSAYVPRLRRGAALALALALGLGAPAARADEPPNGGVDEPPQAGEATQEQLAAARVLFNEGKALEKQKAWADALERFRKVADVKMTPQVRFHIALCEENLGRLVAAINGFELAVQEARRVGQGASEVATNAPARAERLRKRVAAVRIYVQGTIRSSRVLLDGKPVAPALFGTEIPVDPGPHAVTVDREGQTTFSRELTLAERGRESVELEIEDPEPPPEPPAPPARDVAPPPPPTVAPGPDRPPSRLPAIITGAAGLAALAGAGVFFGLREAAFSDVRATCRAEETKQCDPALRERFDDGKTYTTVAAVLGGAGLAALATGGVLWFVLAPERDAAKAASLRVAPVPGGVRFEGAF